MKELLPDELHPGMLFTVTAVEPLLLHGVTDANDEVERECYARDAATESFIGDVVKPLKILIESVYGPIEQRLENAIAERFEIDFVSTASLWKDIDRTMLIAERNALFTPDKVQWTGEDQVERIEIKPICLAPHDAEQMFWNACEELKVAHVPN